MLPSYLERMNIRNIIIYTKYKYNISIILISLGGKHEYINWMCWMFIRQSRKIGFNMQSIELYML